MLMCISHPFEVSHKITPLLSAEIKKLNHLLVRLMPDKKKKTTSILFNFAEAKAEIFAPSGERSSSYSSQIISAH